MKCKRAKIILLIVVLLVCRNSINAQTSENVLAGNWYKLQIILFKQSSASWSLTAADKKQLIILKPTSPFASCSTASTSMCSPVRLPAAGLVLNGQRISADIVMLKWETQAEYNSKGFILERAVTGFNTYDSVFYAIGAGASYSKSEYQHIDLNLNENSSFYRIKQMDNDGLFSYSNVVEIKGGNREFSINVSPNPARSSNIRIYFSIPAKSQTVGFTIFNASGVQVLKKDKFLVTTGYYEFKEGYLPPGFYFVTAHTSNGICSKSFVITQ